MRLVITPGMGVGPEVTLAALQAGALDDATAVLIGRASALHAANQRHLPLEYFKSVLSAWSCPPGRIAVVDAPDDAEPAEVSALRIAVAACQSGQADALVTGPIHKAKLAARGFAYHGHTDFLGALCGGVAPIMAFAGGSLRVALVTVHIPLARVPAAITRAAVVHAGRTAARALRDDLGIHEPHLLLCGLNPHAGEQGLLGHEEIETIAPAAADLRAEGWLVSGPISAETAFMEARAGRGDLVLAMYHDQGLAPLKAVDFGRSVNWTLGLPIVRTSVDHGTADALVGRGLADPSSMVAAIQLAQTILRHRAATGA